jgi:hypothetical protein
MHCLSDYLGENLKVQPILVGLNGERKVPPLHSAMPVTVEGIGLQCALIHRMKKELKFR